LALANIGVSSILAGVFPMPDPRHNPATLGLGFLTVGMLLSPLLVSAVIWQHGISKLVKGLLGTMLLLLLAFVLVRSGVVAWDTSTIEGLVQRLLALVLFGTIGIGSWVLLQDQSHD
jgi:hypothetical protein